MLHLAGGPNQVCFGESAYAAKVHFSVSQMTFENMKEKGSLETNKNINNHIIEHKILMGKILTNVTNFQ